MTREDLVGAATVGGTQQRRPLGVAREQRPRFGASMISESRDRQQRLELLVKRQQPTELHVDASNVELVRVEVEAEPAAV